MMAASSSELRSRILTAGSRSPSPAEAREGGGGQLPQTANALVSSFVSKVFPSGLV